MMKNSLLFLSVLYLIVSCQSEYAERMQKAQKLKLDYLKVQTIADFEQRPELASKLQKLQQEIKFHAQISGNEELFLKQVWEN